ncbi:hypothetical protein [Metabacillus arenae]|uniref:Uncharacterized protein n=1 Tax=Metabacillus arenae TaxID=2771434 RepID=A0A926NC28_9BACI|nr:hypothetical protein [Metabacillus arenae]MBD1378789.1 hypothetical protein [Metabacillus arenae]
MKDLLRQSLNWSVGIAVITFVLAALFTIISTSMLSGVGWALGMLIVFIIVLVGIFFDMLGIAAAAADEVPFHSMASNRVIGAKQSLKIVRNADRFASFCNDVIGDISGIISGTASAIVVIQLTLDMAIKEGSLLQIVINVAFTSLVAALTVGGKAFGKSIAINFSTDIIFQVGKIIYLFEDKFKIPVLKDKKYKKINKQRNMNRK